MPPHCIDENPPLGVVANHRYHKREAASGPSTPPSHRLSNSTCDEDHDEHCTQLLEIASDELERLRRSPITTATQASMGEGRRFNRHSQQKQQPQHPHQQEEAYFPPACLELLYRLPGNDRCVDCCASNPQWASVSYGALLCLNCSGAHRALGVKTSFVRSVRMDTWSHRQILSMLEGGNDQLSNFFGRHSLPSTPPLPTSGPSSSSSSSSSSCARGGGTDPSPCHRYRTKAALFYREHLSIHVSRLMVGAGGEERGWKYLGRRASRKAATTRAATASSSKKSRRNSHGGELRKTV